MPESLEDLLKRWNDGDEAAGQEFFTLAYRELRKVAAVHFKNERQGHTLQPTAIVHEVFMKLATGKPVRWQNKAHFYAVFSRKVRLLLVDHARRRKAAKRQDSRIEFVAAGPRTRYETVLTLNDILDQLEKDDVRASQVLEMRVFGGLREIEIAEALGVSVATVKRDWTYAQAFLKSRLTSP
jgi:RNA polymerase sigma factor (TIGR02999 family)